MLQVIKVVDWAGMGSERKGGGRGESWSLCSQNGAVQNS